MSLLGKIGAGVIYLLPALYTLFFLWWLRDRARRISTGDFDGYLPLTDLMPVHVGFVLLTFVLLIVAVRSVLRRPDLPGSRKTAWVTALIWGSVFAFPVFWYAFIWRRQQK